MYIILSTLIPTNNKTNNKMHAICQHYNMQEMKSNPK